MGVVGVTPCVTEADGRVTDVTPVSSGRGRGRVERDQARLSLFICVCVGLADNEAVWGCLDRVRTRLCLAREEGPRPSSAVLDARVFAGTLFVLFS